MSDRTILRTNLGLLVVVVLFLMGMAFQMGQMATKVDALWTAHAPRLASQSTTGSNP